MNMEEETINRLPEFAKETVLMLTEIVYPVNFEKILKDIAINFEKKSKDKTELLGSLSKFPRNMMVANVFYTKNYSDELAKYLVNLCGNLYIPHGISLIFDIDENEKGLNHIACMVQDGAPYNNYHKEFMTLASVLNVFPRKRDIDLESVDEGMTIHAQYMVVSFKNIPNSSLIVVFSSTVSDTLRHADHFFETILKPNLKKKYLGYSKKTKCCRNPITKSIRHEVFKRDNYACKECGKTKEETSLEIDHIIPVSQGGTDELSNFQTLCKVCNHAKNNRAWKTYSI
jgi:5-methylcytosine-specific restriction protein A